MIAIGVVGRTQREAERLRRQFKDSDSVIAIWPGRSVIGHQLGGVLVALGVDQDSDWFKHIVLTRLTVEAERELTRLRSLNELWQKENALNDAISRLPSDWYVDLNDEEPDASRLASIETRLTAIPEEDGPTLLYYIYYKEDMRWLLDKYRALLNANSQLHHDR